jgi:hypothetical protein
VALMLGWRCCMLGFISRIRALVLLGGGLAKIYIPG